MMKVTYEDLISPATPVIIQARDSNSFGKLIPLIRENALNNLVTSGQGVYGIAGFVRPKTFIASKLEGLLSLYNYFEFPSFNMVSSVLTGPFVDDLLNSPHVANIYKDNIKKIHPHTGLNQ